MLTLIFIAALLILWYVYVSSRRNTKYLKDIPGPKPNVFIGNMDDFMFIPNHKYFDVLMRYLREYGGIVKVHDGPLSVTLVVTDPAFVKHILSSRTFIEKSLQYDFMREWLGDGLLVSTGSKWKQRRRLLTPAFHFSILEHFVDVFESVGNIFIEKLEEEVGKQSADIAELVSLCTLDVICEASMGIKLDALNNKTSAFVRNTKTMCSIVLHRALSVIHPSIYPFTYTSFKEARAIKVLHAYTDKVIDERIKRRETSPKYEVDENTNVKVDKKLAFLDILLNAVSDGEPLSRRDIREEVDTFIFEGHDTTSSAICFTMFSLAANPIIQEEAFLEQKQIYGGERDGKTTTAQLQEMKYLELVIKEALRLYPSVPVLARKVPEDMEWEGHLLPKGLSVVLSTYAMHRDPENFPEPNKFIPERFENANLTNPFIYTPFSAGPRNCIGQKFAMLEMKSIISKVLRNFELLPATPIHELQLSPETILVSKNGVRIALKKRVY